MDALYNCETIRTLKMLSTSDNDWTIKSFNDAYIIRTENYKMLRYDGTVLDKEGNIISCFNMLEPKVYDGDMLNFHGYMIPAKNGIMISIFLYNGKICVINYNFNMKLTDTINNLYKKSNGPHASELFDLRFNNSSTCYTFFIASPIIGHCRHINKKSVYLLNRYEMKKNNYDDCVPGILQNYQTLFIKSMTQIEAHNYINNSDFNNGEAIYNMNFQCGKLIKFELIMSHSYWLRRIIRGNNENVVEGYYNFLDTSIPRKLLPITDKTEIMNSFFEYMKISKSNFDKYYYTYLYCWTLPENVRNKIMVINVNEVKKKIAKWLFKEIVNNLGGVNCLDNEIIFDEKNIKKYTFDGLNMIKFAITNSKELDQVNFILNKLIFKISNKNIYEMNKTRKEVKLDK